GKGATDGQSETECSVSDQGRCSDLPHSRPRGGWLVCLVRTHCAPPLLEGAPPSPDRRADRRLLVRVERSGSAGAPPPAAIHVGQEPTSVPWLRFQARCVGSSQLLRLLRSSSGHDATT